MPTPLIRLSLSFIAGMAVANFLLPHLATLPLFLATCSATALLFFFHTPQPTSTRHRAFVPIAILTAFLISMTLFTHKHNTLAHSIPANSTHCFGILTTEPQLNPRSTALIITQTNGSKICLHVGNDYTTGQPDPRLFSLCIGDTIFANIKHLKLTANPKGGYVNYYNYLFHNGICATAYVPPHYWQYSHSTSALSPLRRLANLQHRLHTVYAAHGIKGDAASVIEAMTIGRKTDITSSTRTAYASSGASHILALSGYHVGVILFMLQIILFKQFVPLRHTWIANIPIILIMWAYTIIAGAPPSLVRATTMITIMLLCQSFTHKLLSLHSLVLTATIMLSFNPLLIANVGFQLSFVSVLSLILFFPHIHKAIHTQNVVLSYILKLVATSIICTIATVPIVAYHFGRISLLSIGTNLVVVPLTIAIIITSILWWSTIYLPDINNLLTQLLIFTTDALNSCVSAIASLPFSSLEWHPSAAGIVLTYLLYAVLYILFRNIVLQLKETQN